MYIEHIKYRNTTFNIIRYLGIYLGYNAHLNEMKNWLEKIDAIESTLHAWGKRDLTLFGRVQILKTLQFQN